MHDFILLMLIDNCRNGWIMAGYYRSTTWEVTKCKFGDFGDLLCICIFGAFTHKNGGNHRVLPNIVSCSYACICTVWFSLLSSVHWQMSKIQNINPLTVVVRTKTHPSIWVNDYPWWVNVMYFLCSFYFYVLCY